LSRLSEPYSTGRLWVAEPHLSGVGVVDYLHRHGAPIRYDYLTRYRADYTGGFNRLLTRGAVFTNVPLIC